MSQDFRLRSDEIEENDIGTDIRNLENECIRNYETDGHVRNINFTLSNGEIIFLNYAYLIAGRCSLAQDQINLKFTSESVEIKGVGLKPLHYDLMFHRPMEIAPVDTRYNATMNQSLPIVNEIKLTE